MNLNQPFQIMGILNVTPDSFSDGGQFDTFERAVEQGKQLAAAGAQLIDIGGQSTRPDYQEVSAEIEKARVVPVVRALWAAKTVPLSVDTYFPEVAKAALEAGAAMINDVTGLDNPEMLRVLQAFPAAKITIMYNRPHPAGKLEESLKEFYREKRQVCEQAGIQSDRILFDPGIGFQKTVAENQALLQDPKRYRDPEIPQLYGVSRKRIIGTLSGEEQAQKRDSGTLAASLYAAEQGIEWHRVHDVAGLKQAFQLWQALKK